MISVYTGDVIFLMEQIVRYLGTYNRPNVEDIQYFHQSDDQYAVTEVRHRFN